MATEHCYQKIIASPLLILLGWQLVQFKNGFQADGAIELVFDCILKQGIGVFLACLMNSVHRTLLLFKLIELPVVEVCHKFHARLERLKFNQDCVFLVIRPLNNTQMFQVCFIEYGAELAALL
jgi:hypothetical protein